MLHLVCNSVIIAGKAAFVNTCFKIF